MTLTIERPPLVVRFLTPTIAVSARPCEHDAEALREAGITHLLDVSCDAGPLTHYRHGFTAMHFAPVIDPVEDVLPESYWAACFAFVKAAIQEGKVLIYCTTGTNRGPTLACAITGAGCDDPGLEHYRDQALTAGERYR